VFVFVSVSVFEFVFGVRMGVSVLVHVLVLVNVVVGDALSVKHLVVGFAASAGRAHHCTSTSTSLMRSS
jgi:hypothetical protein